MDAHRPLSTIDIVDRTVSLYRANFRLFFVLPLLAGSVTFVLQELSMLASPALYLPPQADGNPAAGFASAFASYGASSSLGIVSWFLNLWATCALVYAISRRYVGLDVTVADAIRHSFGRIPYLFVTSLALSFFIVLALVGVGFLLGGLVGGVGFVLDPGSRWSVVLMVVLGIGGMVLLLAGLLWVLRFWLHPATVVIERLGIGAALTRSSELMRQAGHVSFRDRNDVRLTIVLTVLPAIGAAASSLALLPIAILGWGGFVLHWIDFSKPEKILHLLMSPLIAVQLAAGALLHPLSIGVTVLFYYDLRYRIEGLDLEMRALSLRKPRPQRAASPAP